MNSGGQVHSHSQQGLFWGRADPPGPLFATGLWAASLQPGQPLPGHLWRRQVGSTEPERVSLAPRQLEPKPRGRNSLEKVLDLSSEPLTP